MIDSFHERLVMGTATYALEFLKRPLPWMGCMCLSGLDRPFAAYPLPAMH